MYRGFFLNLDRNSERREALVRRLAEVGAAERYERLEAIDGQPLAAQYPTRMDPGNLGLWLTHEKIVGQMAQQPDLHLHLIEDDAFLPPNIVALLENLLNQLEKQN